MFRSYIHINTPLIMNMNIICEQLRLFLRTWVKSFVRRKMRSKLSGTNSAATRWNLGGTNLGLRQSCTAGETSLREGEIIAIVITNAPLIGRGAISINIFTNTISSPNPSSSLVSNSGLQVRDWCQQVASSVDYSLQLMLVGLIGGRSYVQILYAY